MTANNGNVTDRDAVIEASLADIVHHGGRLAHALRLLTASMPLPVQAEGAIEQTEQRTAQALQAAETVAVGAAAVAEAAAAVAPLVRAVAEAGKAGNEA